jgi:type I restriction enzyme S subunit
MKTLGTPASSPADEKMPMGTSALPGIMPKLRFPEFRKAPAWGKALLGEIAEIKLGKMLDGKKHTTGRLLPYLNNISVRWNEIDTSNLPEMYFDDDELDRFGLRAGDIVVCEGGEPGRSAVWDGRLPDLKFQKAIHRVRFNVPFEPRLLVLYLESIAGTTRFERLFTGGGIKHLTRETFAELNIPVILPAEQQKIAGCLSTLDELIGAESQKLDALKAHKKGLMQQLFPREGETVPRLRFPEFQNTQEWEEKSVGDFGDVVTGSTPSTAKLEYYGGNISFVSPADISELRFVEETKTTLTELGFEETRPIRAGSILFVCIGSTIGKVAQNVHACATNQQINSVVPNSDHDDAFVYYALVKNSDRVANIAGKQAVPIVNKTQFSSVRLLVPKLNEQQRVALCLSSLDELIAAQSNKLEALKTHKKGLMQQLFPSAVEAQA